RRAVQLLPAVVAEDVHALGEVVVGVFVVADAGAADVRADADGAVAVFEPLLAQLVLVFAGVEEAGDGGGGDGRPLRARAEAVVHGPVGTRALFQILVGFLDGLLGHRDAGVAGGAERLHLRDRDRAFVVVAAFGLGDVIPATAAGLRRDGVLDAARENVLELLAALAVLFIAVDAGEKQEAEAVAVHVAPSLGGVIRIADEPIAAAALHAPFHQPIRGAADVIRVLPVLDRAAFHEEGHAGEGRHRYGALICVGAPVPVLVLL